MKPSKKKVFTVLGLILCCLCLWRIGTGLDYLYSFSQKVNLVIDSSISEYDSKSAKIIQEENRENEINPLSFVVWKQENKELLVRGDELKEINASVLALCGRSDLIVSSQRTLEIDDSEQCLIGKMIAEQLFGTLDVINQTIVYNGLEYTIVGIVEDIEEIFVYQTGNEYVEGLNRITINKNPEESEEIKANEFQSRFFSYGDEVVSYSFLLFIIQLLVSIFPLMITFEILKCLILEVRKKQGSIMWRGISATLAVIIGIGSLIACLQFITIPTEIIPTKWSDASFWVNALDNKMHQMKFFLNMEKTMVDQQYLDSYILILVLSAIVLYVYVKWINLWLKKEDNY